MRFSLSPALVLFLLAPSIAELLSGSAPPAEFFNPIVFLLICSLYGCGALLTRELTVRWGKGWAALLLLGMAFGILNEGLACKSFFDPDWFDLGVLRGYGRWGGVNWPWTIFLTVYHTVFSMAIPILLVELAFPNRRFQPWIGDRALRAVSGWLALETLALFLVISPYRPAWHGVALAVLAISGLVGLARWLPHSQQELRPGAVASPWVFGCLGFFTTLVFFVMMFGLPGAVSPPETMLAAVALVATVAGSLMVLSGGGRSWLDSHRLALAGGALSFFILLAPLQEMDPTRPDDTRGMALVGLAAALLLGLMARRVSSRTTAGAEQGSVRGP
ncbi:MAG: hypothetical protein HY319_23290 [Armatimonadetes bacterium]|nr:hypothetical protein [Armatimonadota bacterium]